MRDAVSVPVVSLADSLTAPAEAEAEAGGGEYARGPSVDAAMLRVLRAEWRRQLRAYGRYDRVTRDTFQRLRWCSAYLIGRGC